MRSSKRISRTAQHKKGAPRHPFQNQMRCSLCSWRIALVHRLHNISDDQGEDNTAEAATCNVAAGVAKVGKNVGQRASCSQTAAEAADCTSNAGWVSCTLCMAAHGASDELGDKVCKHS